MVVCFFFFQAEDGIRDLIVTGVQTCALPIYDARMSAHRVEDARVVAMVVAHVVDDRVELFERAKGGRVAPVVAHCEAFEDRKSTRLNSSHDQISYAVFCLKKKKKKEIKTKPI